MVSTVKAMLNLVDKEVGDLLLLHNGDLEEKEIMKHLLRKIRKRCNSFVKERNYAAI